MLHSVAVCCSVLQCVAVYSLPITEVNSSSVLQRVAACCSVLQSVAVYNLPITEV